MPKSDAVKPAPKKKAEAKKKPPADRDQNRTRPRISRPPKCVIAPSGLPLQWEVFCIEFVKDRNGAAAADRTGYISGKYKAYDLLTRPEIRARIDELAAGMLKNLEITAERVLQEVGKLAFANIADLYDGDGKLMAPKDMDPFVSAALQEVTEDTLGVQGDSDTVLTRRKMKLADKRGSLELLGRNLKLWTDKVEHSGSIGLSDVLADIDGRSRGLPKPPPK